MPSPHFGLWLGAIADGNQTAGCPGIEGGMPIFTPALHKQLEASLYRGNVMVPGVATAAAQLLRWGRCWLTVAALVASAQTGRAQEVPGIACIIKADTGNADIGRVSALRGLPGDGVLPCMCPR
jgi:hypothetical protein